MVTFRAYVLVVYSLLLAGVFVVPTAIAANRVDILPARQHAVTPIQSINYNSVKIRCLVGENSAKQSRAIVLKMQWNTKEFRKYDIALATGHGLLGNNGQINPLCSAIGSDGKPYKILVVSLAENFQVGTPTDWAVVGFKKMKNPNITRFYTPRLTVYSVFEDMAMDHQQVQFSKAIGLPFNGQDCTLVPRKSANLTSKKLRGFLAHDCSSVAGQSGTPVSIKQNGASIVLGMHIGNVFSYGLGENIPARFYGYMRVIDGEFIRSLEARIRDLETQFEQLEQ